MGNMTVNTSPLIVYGSKSSYFSGKLETCLRYKEIPHEFRSISPGIMNKIRDNTGVYQLPAVELPDGKWLTDSTPVISWLESEYPASSVYPSDPASRFLSLLVEDFADEWLWRPAMHYRWSFSEDRFTRATRLAREISGDDRPLPLMLRRKMIQQRQLGIFIRGDGIDAATREHADHAYLRILDILEPILQNRPYLLGDRPSLTDIAFMGPMFRHFAQDPTPGHIMAERAPGVWEWVARTWNARSSRLGSRSLLDHVPSDWDPILRESAQTHLELLDANARAHQAGLEEHDLEIQGVTYRGLPTSPYRVWCLEQLRARYGELDETAALAVRERLEAAEAWEPLWRTSDLASGHDPSDEAPFCSGSRVMPEERSIPAAALHHRRSLGRTAEHAIRTAFRPEQHQHPERSPHPSAAARTTPARGTLSTPDAISNQDQLKRPSAVHLGLRAALRRAGMHPADTDGTTFDVSGKRALIVATNVGVLDVGKPTGVFASEMTVPYYAFNDGGMEVDIASPEGGVVPIDPQSIRPIIRTADDDRFLADDSFRAKVTKSLAIGELDMSSYDVVFLAGGWGAAFDFGSSEALATKMTEANDEGLVMGGVCHGPLGFLNATNSDGEPLVQGRKVTAVTDKQVKELGIQSTPHHPERELRAAGAAFESQSRRRDPLANHWVVDGRLVTGQNQNAGPMVAREMMRLLLQPGSE